MTSIWRAAARRISCHRVKLWVLKNQHQRRIGFGAKIFIDYSDILPVDVLKTLFNSSEPPFLVFGFSVDWAISFTLDDFIAILNAISIWMNQCFD